MQYLGDYAEDYATLNFKFSTHKADGTPITLAGTPAVSVYKGNNTTQTTTGVTLTVDFDTVTGLHNVLIDLSADAFYAVANDYAVVITAGTVNSISVVGTVIAHFSIENRYIEADVIKVSGTTQTAGDLAALITTLDTVADGIKAKTDSLTFTVAGDVDANVQSWKGSTAPDIATEAQIADAVLDEAASGHTGLIAVALPNAVPGANGGLPTTNGTKLNQTVDLTSGQSIAVNDKTGFSLATAEHTSIADALLKRDWTQITGEAARSALNALRFLRNKFYTSGGSIYITKEDDSSEAWHGTPTTDADADPITGFDPST